MPPRACAHRRSAGFNGRSPPDSHRGPRLRCGAPSPGHHRGARGPRVLPLWRGPVFRNSRRRRHQARDQLLDRSYSARPLADRLATFASPSETVAVFRVRRDIEYGLSFYRNREVVNYEEDGVPDEEHLLVARVSGRGGKDLHTQDALEEYLEGRQYEHLFSWPEQGLRGLSRRSGSNRKWKSAKISQDLNLQSDSLRGKVTPRRSVRIPLWESQYPGLVSVSSEAEPV